MCYPYGSFDDNTISILKEKSCSYAFTTASGIADLNKNHFKLIIIFRKILKIVRVQKMAKFANLANFWSFFGKDLFVVLLRRPGKGRAGRPDDFPRLGILQDSLFNHFTSKE